MRKVGLKVRRKSSGKTVWLNDDGASTIEVYGLRSESSFQLDMFSLSYYSWRLGAWKLDDDEKITCSFTNTNLSFFFSFRGQSLEVVETVLVAFPHHLSFFLGPFWNFLLVSFKETVFHVGRRKRFPDWKGERVLIQGSREAAFLLGWEFCLEGWKLWEYVWRDWLGKVYEVTLYSPFFGFVSDVYWRW